MVFRTISCMRDLAPYTYPFISPMRDGGWRGIPHTYIPKCALRRATIPIPTYPIAHAPRIPYPAATRNPGICYRSGLAFAKTQVPDPKKKSDLFFHTLNGALFSARHASPLRVVKTLRSRPQMSSRTKGDQLQLLYSAGRSVRCGTWVSARR